MFEWCMMMWCRRNADAGRDLAGWRKDGGGPGGHPGGSLVEGSGGPPVLSGDGPSGGGADAPAQKDRGTNTRGGGVRGLPRRGRAMDQAEQDLGDRVLVVQAPDRWRTRREVPDASMWGSCFTLFERAALLVDPARGPELSAYRETIQRAARTHQWDFVRRNFRQFRQSAVGDASRSWAKLDSTLFMQELAGPQAAYLASGFRGLADRTAHLPEKGVVRPGPGVTWAARTGRKGLASAISLMSRTGCANSEPSASLGMPAQSAGAITPGPGETVPRWSGGGDTRAGGDQELAWDSERGERWWTCEGAGRSPRPCHLETF